MKRKKGFTFSELIVFLFLFSLMGVFVFSVLQDFFSGAENNKKIEKFSNVYNDMMEYIYANGYNQWKLATGYDNKLVLYNSGEILGYSGYIGYDCMEEGMGITYIYSGEKIKNRDDYQKIFTGFNCYNLDGRKAHGGYRLGFEIELLSKKFDLKHFIFTE